MEFNLVVSMILIYYINSRILCLTFLLNFLFICDHQLFLYFLAIFVNKKLIFDDEKEIKKIRQ